MALGLLNPRVTIVGFFFGLIACFLTTTVAGQAITIGSAEDMRLRNEQLLGKFDSSVSFTVRPLIRSKETNWKKPLFSVLPLTLIQQYNTHHPYGWNDGAMIAANGYQAMLSAGIRASYGAFEVQLMPELVYANNPSYASNTAYGSNAGGPYQKLFPGQSFIKASIGAISAGLTSQNLWWGPGIRSSLLMSNNAPGFVHGFISSRKPAKTPIGDFEWQLIGGKLTADDNRAYENFNLKPPASPLNKDWRYLSAYVISYHPKWVPGLFLGMTRAIQRYKQSLVLSKGNFLNEYIPVVAKAFSKQNEQGDDTLGTDQLASFYARWVLPKAKAEFYVEWGYNDYNYNTRDYLMGPTHSAAHLVGFKKIVELTKDSYLDFGVELTEMSQSPDYLVREAGNWYVHGQIFQGYTHQNQIMGAGAGLGCNVQSITATWVKGMKQWGILLERVERDPQYHANKWTDLSIGIMPQWKYQNLLISGIVQFINSSNYAWDKDVNRFNVHSRLSVQYQF
ncbi:MAG: capsule assembly Wzi family protein [Bacteroidota bacterium]